MKTAFSQQKIPLITGVLFLFLAVPLTAAASFRDVPSDYRQVQAIEAMEEMGIIEGYADGTFQPEKPVSKAEFLTMIFRHVGYKPVEKPYPTGYSDVPSGSWFAPYVKKARELNLIPQGNTFGPADSLSRTEALRILLPLEGIPTPYVDPSAETGFEDVPGQSPYAYLVRAAQNSGVFVEEEGDRFLPHQVLRRGDAAELIYKAGLYSYENPSLVQPPSISIDRDPSLDSSITQSELLTNPKFPILVNVWTKINNQYLRQESVSQNDLIYGAINGMVESLDDPFSVFREPETAKDLEEDLSGNYEGIGTVLDIYENEFIIIGIIKDSPAEKSGLKTGDVITKVDETETQNLSTEEIISLIKGPAGSTVKMTVRRDNQIKVFTVTREKISLASVLLPTPDIEVPSNIGYIAIYQFTEYTDQDFAKILEETLKKNPKGLILDLRSNPGGYVTSSLNVLEMFIEKGKILTKIKTGGRIIDEKSLVDPTIPATLPVVVLVNSGSASAAEIVAGALQDHGRATLIGEQTYGKGTVQEVSTYTDGSLLKLTIAEWLTPSGTNIDHAGLTPDIVVKATKDDAVGKTDSQLSRAITELQKMF